MADYVKTDWTTGDTITEALADHWETQYDVAKAELEAGAWALYFSGAVSTNRGLGIEVSGDSYDRFRVLASGECQWGTGAATQDVNLYRGGSNQLKTDDAFSAGGLISTTGGVDAAGYLKAGNYLTIVDWTLTRDAANSATASGAFGCGDLVADDITVRSGKKIYFGGADVNLYDGGTDTLKTDDAFECASVASSGAVSGSSLSVTGNASADGQMTADYFEQSTAIVARAYRSAAQSVGSSTLTTVNFDTESFDPGSDYDTSNHRYVVPVDGYYRVSATVGIASSLSDGAYVDTSIYNGSTEIATNRAFDSSGTKAVKCNVYDILDCTSGDYIYIKVYHTSPNTENINIGSANTLATFELITKK